VCFLDDDDVYLEGRLALGLEAMRSAPLGICWRAKDRDRPGRATGRTLNGDVSDVILEGSVPHLNATTVLRAEALPFREDLPAAEDVDWWFRMTQRVPVSTVPVGGYRGRPHIDESRRLITLGKRAEARQQMLDDYSAYFQSHPRAAAYAWRRIGQISIREGRWRAGTTAFGRALRIDPRPRNALAITRAALAAIVKRTRT
jgi:hypothetical protein